MARHGCRRHGKPLAALLLTWLFLASAKIGSNNQGGSTSGLDDVVVDGDIDLDFVFEHDNYVDIENDSSVDTDDYIRPAENVFLRPSKPPPPPLSYANQRQLESISHVGWDDYSGGQLNVCERYVRCVIFWFVRSVAFLLFVCRRNCFSFRRDWNSLSRITCYFVPSRKNDHSNCRNDDDCAGHLKCFVRETSGEDLDVPGCSGTPSGTRNVCYDPCTVRPLQHVGWGDYSGGKLGVCER